jgi:D-aminopeptidase
VFAALDSATGGPVAEGNVGGGTGMNLFGFKGGVGTSSRIVSFDGRDYHIGVQVQGNFGARIDLLVDGVPVGREITDLRYQPGAASNKEGSVIVVIGTDLPLSDRQLRRLCKRGMLGLSRVGAIGGQSSGDLLIAFSNALENRVRRGDLTAFHQVRRFNDSLIDPVFRATIEATAEAVLNAMVAAETMVGRDGNTAYAIPHDRLREVMRKYGRLAD